MTVLYVKDNIISTSVSEAVEKTPTVEKMIIANAPLCVLLYSVTAYKEQLCRATDQLITNIEIVVYLLGCIQCS